MLRAMSPSGWFDSRMRRVLAGAALAVLVGSCGERAAERAAESAADTAADTALVWIEPGAEFRWHALGYADLYRLELFDARGELLGGAVTRDTVVPAAAVVPDTANVGAWRVVPVSAGGTEMPPFHAGTFRRR